MERTSIARQSSYGSREKKKTYLTGIETLIINYSSGYSKLINNITIIIIFLLVR